VRKEGARKEGSRRSWNAADDDDDAAYLCSKISRHTKYTSIHTHSTVEGAVCVRGAGQFRFLIAPTSPPPSSPPSTTTRQCWPASATTQEEDIGRLLGCFYSSVASSSWWWVAFPGRRAFSWRPAPPPPPPVVPVCSWGRRIVRVRGRPSRPLCPGLFLGT